MLSELIDHLEGQGGDVEILTDNNLGYSIGEKRNKLLKRATGDYIAFIDDDDMVVSDYVYRILEATKTNPDCIGTSGKIIINGTTEQQWHISREFGSWYEKDGIYYRTPNHISPVKRELALQTMFKEVNMGEDADYSQRLLPLLKTEVIIEGNIYYYLYVDKGLY
jgi:hypothetical protein